MPNYIQYTFVGDTSLKHVKICGSASFQIILAQRPVELGTLEQRRGRFLWIICFSKLIIVYGHKIQGVVVHLGYDDIVAHIKNTGKLEIKGYQ